MSHGAHFTVRRVICVLCICILYFVFVNLMGLKPNPLVLSYFCALTLLVGSFDPLRNPSLI